MKLFIAWVHDLDEPFDPAVHCIPGEAFSVALKQEEGGVQSVSLTRQQIGWAILNPAEPKNVLISECMTGRPEDARLISRARLTTLPKDLFGETQTLTLASAPADVEERLKQYALDNLASDPDYEPLLSANDGNVTNDKLEDVNALDYLEHRSEAVHYDPVTHEISTSDIIRDPNGRLINMANAAFEGDISVAVGEGPVTRVTIKATVQWTQEAKGFCNIGTRLYPITTVAGVGQDFQMPVGMVDYGLGYGWEQFSDEARSTVYSSPIFSTNINVEQKKDVYGTYFRGYAKIFNEGGDSYTQGDPQYGVGRIDTYWSSSRRYDSIKIYNYDYGNTLMKFSFSQPRSEDIYVTLDLEAQSAPVVKSTLDLGQVQISDPTDDPFSDPYEPGVYKKGERVQLGGVVYEALEDHTSTAITQQKSGSPIVYDHFKPFNEADTHPYWKVVPSAAPMPYRWQATFGETTRGNKTFRNLLLRCRKKGLERLRYMNVTFLFRWQDANTITLKDSLRVCVPYGDGTTRPIVGKVVAIEKTWDGETGAMISVTIGVPFGTGLDERPDVIPAAYDVVAAGVLDDYPEDVDAYVAGDTKWVWEGAPLRRPIDASRLSDPTYAVMGVKKIWMGDAQFARIQSNAWAGREPNAPVTQVQVSMRPLIAEGNINRDYDVYGAMKWSPRGIDLVHGGEP